MSGRSRRVVMAFVVVMSLLVATAPAAHAANVSGQLEVASQHTTFGTGSGESSPATLTNASVSGSGTSASVSFGTEQTVYNPFDDEGDGASDNNRQFLGDDSGNTVYNTEVQIQPDTSTEITALKLNIGATSGATTDITVDVYLVQEAPDQTYGEGTKIVSDYSPTWSTGEQTIPLDSSVSVSSGTTYTLEFVTSGDNDGSGDWLAVQTDDSAGSAWLTNSQFGTFNEYADVGLVRDSVQTSAQYVGANHSAENIQEVTYNLTISNGDADLVAEYWDGSSWVVANSTTVSSDGNHTVGVSATADTWRANVTVTSGSGATTASLHDEQVLFDASAPSGSNPDPTDGSEIDNYDGDISIDVNDTDFGLSQGDTVTVTADNQNGQIDQTTVNSNGTVTFSYTALAGQNNITWTLSDSYGQSTTVDQQFSIPGNLTVRKETNETEIIKSPITVHGTFYPDEGVTVVEKNTTTGNISMEGLPAGDEFVVTLEADGYYNREIYLEDIFEQQNVYLLNSTQFPDAKTVEFVLDDRTGRFNPDDSTIRIQRALDPDDDGNSTWTTVAGDKFNAAGAYFFTGETGARYRVIVENDQNERRVLGPYTMTESRVENLVIGQVEWPALNGSATAFAANVTQDPVTSVTPPAIAVRYQDPMNNTTDLTVTVVERGNTSNQIFTDSVTGNTSRYYNEVNLTENQASNKTWLVNASYTYQGDSYTQTRVVGTKTLDLPIDPNWLGGAIFVFIPMLITLFGPRTWQYGLGITLGVVGIFMMFTWIDIPLAAYAAAIVIAIGGVMRTELTLQ